MLILTVKTGFPVEQQNKNVTNISTEMGFFKKSGFICIPNNGQKGFRQRDHAAYVTGQEQHESESGITANATSLRNRHFQYSIQMIQIGSRPVGITILKWKGEGVYG